MGSVDPNAGEHATDTFRTTLERKWKKEAEQWNRRAQEEARDLERLAAHAPAEMMPLEPVLATHGRGVCCSICRSYIECGESIVSADGTAWVHTPCAEREGWDVQ